MIELTRQLKQLSLYRHLENSGEFNGSGLEATTSVMPVQCSYQLSYEATCSSAVVNS